MKWIKESITLMDYFSGPKLVNGLRKIIHQDYCEGEERTKGHVLMTVNKLRSKNMSLWREKTKKRASVRRGSGEIVGMWLLLRWLRGLFSLLALFCFGGYDPQVVHPTDDKLRAFAENLR